MQFRYPCTGPIKTDGFGEFLQRQLREPRRNIEAFKEQLRYAFGASYISLVNSGSSANLVAALAMAEKVRASKRSMVAAVSALSFPTTISSLLLAGFKVCVVDTAPGSFNIDTEKLKATVADNDVSIIVPTHMLGFPADLESINRIAKPWGCLILQDACETLDVRAKGLYKDEFISCLEIGDICTWSFYHPHHLSSFGGGAVVCKRPDDTVLVESIMHWGRACMCHINQPSCKVAPGPAHQFTYIRPGVNVEISELNACFGRWQLDSFNLQEAKRKENYAILYNKLKDISSIKVYPSPEPDWNVSAFVFPITTKNSNVMECWEKLSKRGVEIRTLMGGPCNTHQAFAGKLESKPTPEAIYMYNHTFFVGIHQTLPTEDVEAVADILAETFG